MGKSNVALRLQPALLDEARRVSESEGVALNQFINVAVAEKLSALRTEEYFRLRSSRADIPQAMRILNRAGKGKPPVPGESSTAPAKENRLFRATRSRSSCAPSLYPIPWSATGPARRPSGR